MKKLDQFEAKDKLKAVGWFLMFLVGLVTACVLLFSYREDQRNTKRAEKERLLEVKRQQRSALEGAEKLLFGGMNWGGVSSSNLQTAKTIISGVLEEDGSNYRALVDRGLIRFLEGDHELAREDFLAAKKVESEKPAAHMYLGLIARKNDDLVVALSHLEEASKYAPDDPLVQYNLGTTCLLAGRLVCARDALSRAAARRPSEVRIASALGNLAAKEGNYREAISIYREAIRQNAKDPVLHGNLASVLLLIGDTKAAEVALDNALRLQGSGEDALRPDEFALTMLCDLERRRGNSTPCAEIQAKKIAELAAELGPA